MKDYLELLDRFINKNSANLKDINEEDTSAVLVEGLLRCLGWNVENVCEVKRQYPNGLKDASEVRKKLFGEHGKNVTLGDYVLFDNDKEIKVVIEVKPLSSSSLWGDSFHFDRIPKGCSCSVCKEVGRGIVKHFVICIKIPTVKHYVWTTADTILIWDLDASRSSNIVEKLNDVLSSFKKWDVFAKAMGLIPSTADSTDILLAPAPALDAVCESFLPYPSVKIDLRDSSQHKDIDEITKRLKK